MSVYTRTAQGIEGLPTVNDPSRLQKLHHMVRQELRLIASAALKIGAVLLILEALAWFAAMGEPLAPQAVATSEHTRQVEKPAAPRAESDTRAVR
ncbi:MAG: hypothetical protein FJY56_13110 [Betaproteobacteria bacterium]|nr:hypothetical protein [Betaproteobacteria bacterium]